MPFDVGYIDDIVAVKDVDITVGISDHQLFVWFIVCNCGNTRFGEAGCLAESLDGLPAPINRKDAIRSSSVDRFGTTCNISHTRIGQMIAPHADGRNRLLRKRNELMKQAVDYYDLSHRSKILQTHEDNDL